MPHLAFLKILQSCLRGFLVSISFSLVNKNDFLILGFAFPNSHSSYSPQAKRETNHLKQRTQKLPKNKGKALLPHMFGVITRH